MHWLYATSLLNCNYSSLSFPCTVRCVFLQSMVWRSALASINEVNLRRARLVLRWATMSRVGKWVPASAGKAKAGIVHFVSGTITRGVQVKLWHPLRTRSIPERLGGVFTTTPYTNPRSPYLTLHFHFVSYYCVSLCDAVRHCIGRHHSCGADSHHSLLHEDG